MNLITTINNNVNLKSLNQDFYDRFKKGVEDYGKAVIIASGFRGWLHQFTLWQGYRLFGNGAPANEPGRSAHNFGLAVDAHPANGIEDDYALLGECLSKYGIKRSTNPKERWHYQCNSFKMIPMAAYLIIASCFFLSSL